MKVFFLVAISFFYVQVFGQEVSQSLLHVSGKAEMSVKPTTTIVSLDIRSSNETYAGAVQELTERVDLLVKVLKGLKFKENEILTSNFSVDKNYAYIDGQRTATGFNGLQTLKVQFEQEKERLLSVLTEVTGSKADPEITVSFDLDDESKDKLKQELMLQAVSDASEKANLIAEQAGHKVSGIKEIKYGLSSGDVPYQGGGAMFEMAARSSDVQVSNFEVSDLTMSDQVLIVFQIVPK